MTLAHRGSALSINKLIYLELDLFYLVELKHRIRQGSIRPAIQSSGTSIQHLSWTKINQSIDCSFNQFAKGGN